MRLWEVAGWLLLVLGLFIFYWCFALLVSDQPRIIEAGPLTVIGIVIFRGGVHLLKIAAAARVTLTLPEVSPAAGGKATRVGRGEAKGLQRLPE